MSKLSLINADDAIKSYIKYSSLSEGIYQALVAKPHQISRLIRIAVNPEHQGIIQTHYPLVVCQILQNYPYLLLVLFSLEGNANCLFDFLNNKPNQTQLGYFSRIVSLFNSNTQEQALRYLKQNNKVLGLCFDNIQIPAIFRFLFDCTILCKKEYEIRSIILMKLYKQIIIDPSEELAQSIKDTLVEIIENYNILNTVAKQTICNIFDEEYIREILSLIRKNENSYVSQFCLSIISKVIVLYFKIKNQISQSLKTSTQSPETNEKQKQKLSQLSQIKTSHIDNGISHLLTSLKMLYSMLQFDSQETHMNQLNEIVPNITFIKFKLSQLLKTIVTYFSIEELTKHQFSAVHLLRIIMININPWANLVHNQLTQISLMIIQKNKIWDQSIVDILNELMDLFKNRYYIFLNSGITVHQGNTHHLYLIIKKLSLELDNNAQLENIFTHCKAWKKFLITDIQKYENNIQANSQLYPKSQQNFGDSTIGNLIIKINERNSNVLINQFINDLNDSYVAVKDYTIWDKKKERLE